jgi:hypothetical protein
MVTKTRWKGCTFWKQLERVYNIISTAKPTMAGVQNAKSAYFFCGSGIGIQGFTFAKQVLYHLSHTSSPFCSDYFGEWGGSQELFAWAGLKLQSQPPK